MQIEGHHRHPAPREPPGHREGGGAAVQDDRLAIADQRVQLGGDGVLDGGVRALADGERGRLAPQQQADRPATHPAQHALFGQLVEIPANGHLRGAGAFGQLSDGDPPLFLQQIDDHPDPRCAFHTGIKHGKCSIDKSTHINRVRSVLGGFVPRSSITPVATAGLFLSFLLIGVQQSLYGPASPALTSHFGISLGSAGLALAAQFTGSLTGVLCTPALRGRISNRAFIGLAGITLAAGCVAFTLAPAWPIALAAAVLSGLGFGWIDVGVNELFLEAYGTEGTGRLNVLHAAFGIGAVVGPFLIGALPFGSWPLVFLGCGAVSLLVAASARGLGGRAPLRQRVTGRSGARLLVGLFMLFFVLHVGVETAGGGWETSHLVGLGWTASTAAMLTSVFWLASTAARFAIVPLARRFCTVHLLAGSLAIMLIGCVLIFVDPLVPVGYAVIGFGMGPLFPTGLVWLAQQVPAATSPVMAASMLGGLFPAVVGSAVNLWGTAAIPPALTVTALACVVTAGVIGRLNVGTREDTTSERSTTWLASRS
ncbi:MFS transporter [Pseudonocardiaceae bacterium YIM PH 21723]|nr:MFS transporter [Pseudonocardiaceae bacterium YIM PH 21723]